MEFRLNKIDTDLRQKINEATKEGKVHSAKSIHISEDLNDDRKNNSQSKKYKSQANEKAKLFVHAVKSENVEVEAFKDTEDYCDSTIGVLLDTKK